MSERIHLIAIGGSVMHNFALALHHKGYQVSGSDDEVYDPAKSRLAEVGLLPKSGWDTANVHEQLDAVIVGMHARKDNPELLKALELDLPVYSFPAYFYENTKDKKRIVIAGSHGKTTTTAIIMHILNHNNIEADYLVGAQLPGYDTMVKLSDAPLAIIEGDEYLSSPIDRRPKFLHYKPHIAIITGIAWDHINVFPTFEGYVNQFRIFLENMHPESVVFWYANDDILSDIVPKTAKSIGFRQESYKVLPHQIISGETMVSFEEDAVKVPLLGQHNLENLRAAQLVSNELGISTNEFADAAACFPGAAKRLQLMSENENQAVYFDFAHAPSKVLATVSALYSQYPDRKLAACLELHTFSSLSDDFLPQYAHTLDGAEMAAVYFSPHTLKMKKLPELSANKVKQAFARPDLEVFTDVVELQKWWLNVMKTESANLLLMSSGRFDGAKIPEVVV